MLGNDFVTKITTASPCNFRQNLLSPDPPGLNIPILSLRSLKPLGFNISATGKNSSSPTPFCKIGILFPDPPGLNIPIFYSDEPF